MPKQNQQTTISKSTKNDANSRYIDFKLDFSFRHFFAKAHHLDLLKDFLNGIFKGRKVIEQVELSKADHKGDQKASRRTVFDVYCTGDKGEKFVVEMQKGSQKYFKDRILFYTANLVQEQGRSVDPDWDYELPEVYFVAVMDFRFEDIPKSHYVHDVRLMEVNSNRQFYDKLGYIFIELPGFTKTASELETNEDKWLFCLKHMGRLNEIPVSLNNSLVFKKLFKVAEVSNLSPEDMNAYQQELKRKRDNYSHDQFILEKGREEERAKAFEDKKEIARNFKNLGVSISDISKGVGLSIKEIESL